VRGELVKMGISGIEVEIGIVKNQDLTPILDIITHHYFDIDAETVFIVCSERISEMKMVVDRILGDLQK